MLTYCRKLIVARCVSGGTESVSKRIIPYAHAEGYIQAIRFVLESSQNMIRIGD